MELSRVVASLTSPVFWTFVLLSVVGIVFVRRAWQDKSGFSDTDKMATLWFLLNATWFHTGCDIMSGLFQVMPNIILGHSPHILMSNLDRLIASLWIVVSVALTVRAARQVGAR